MFCRVSFCVKAVPVTSSSWKKYIYIYFPLNHQSDVNFIHLRQEGECVFSVRGHDWESEREYSCHMALTFTERPKLLTDSLIRALINWLCVCVFLFSGISSSASSLHSVALGDHWAVESRLMQSHLQFSFRLSSPRVTITLTSHCASGFFV